MNTEKDLEASYLMSFVNADCYKFLRKVLKFP